MQYFQLSTFITPTAPNKNLFIAYLSNVNTPVWNTYDHVQNQTKYISELIDKIHLLIYNLQFLL